MSADGLHVTYLDSSALAKLILRERETGALRRFLLHRNVLASSAVARVEVLRAARRHGSLAVRRARNVLAGVKPLRIDDGLIDSASFLDPLSMRTLDAIHLAAAMAIGDDLDVVITYDAQMAAAAESLGLPVEAPSWK